MELSPRHAVYVGSFDPLTLGHEDIIRRGAKLFDKLTVGIGINPDKKPLFSPDERVALSREVLSDLANVFVDCFEGLACGPAMEERWKMVPEEIPPDHEAWKIEARYIARAVVNLVCILSPRRVIIGGGIMDQTHLFGLIRKDVLDLLNGYIQAADVLENIDEYIVPPGLGNRSGVLGALALAREASG